MVLLAPLMMLYSVTGKGILAHFFLNANDFNKNGDIGNANIDMRNTRVGRDISFREGRRSVFNANKC